MNGTIAQIVALTCHGNAYLHGHSIPNFFPENSTCKFCDRVNFAAVSKTFFGRTKEKPIAETPDAWFSFLRSSKASGIRIQYMSDNHPDFSDRMTAGLVGGGGTWSMEVIQPGNRSDRWFERWMVWNRDAPENRIWRVTYGKVSAASTSRATADDLSTTTDQLAKSLREIRDFSQEHECDMFTQYFNEALDTLDSGGRNLHGYHQDLAPEGFLSPQANMILDACQRCWVFGAMGSWNDMVFEGEDQKNYEDVSERAFQTIINAIVSATNTTLS